MKKNKSANKLKAIIVSGLLTVIILTAAGVIFYSLGKTDSFYLREITLNSSNGMTIQQYSEDFELLCSQIEENIPMLYDHEELYGISYEEIKKYYENAIKKADTDYKYYSIVRSFFNNIPSRHLAAGFPLTSSIDSEFRKSFEENISFVSAQEYWFDVLHDECQKYYDRAINQMIFAYYSGEYRGIAKQTGHDVYSINKAALLTVNNIPVDEFIKICPSVSKIKYDHINQKPMRDTLIFNDSLGEECIIEYLDSAGKKHTMQAFYGFESDPVITYMDYFKRIDGVISADNSQTYPDSEDYIRTGSMRLKRNEQYDVLYAEIDSFDDAGANGEAMANAISLSSDGIGNIIIDLRNNRGGFYEYALDVLGALSAESIEITKEIYVTEAFRQQFKDKRLYEFDTNTGLYKRSEKETVMGTANEKKNIYLLISDTTASAADMLAYEFKQNDLGTVIGTNNTGGESYGMLCINYSDISGIYYTYTGYSSYNPDSSVNSVYGTSPDIYLNTYVDNYFIRDKISEDGHDPYDWENRLKWDNPLSDTLKMIKENTP